MNEKTRLILLITILAVVSFVLLRIFTSQTKTVITNKPKYLCDSRLADCSKQFPSGIPRGVCLPGGKCT